VWPAEFVAGVRNLCDRYRTLLIADEVLTGFGRCGKMFASELAGIVPDIMCLSKGLTGGFLPLAATVCTPAVHYTFRSTDRSRTFFHGHSYTANPLGCAAAIASLKIFDSEPVFERIAAIEKTHRQQMPSLAKHPAVAAVRTIGTVMALELKADDPGYFSELRPALYDFYLNKGVLLRPLGNVIYFMPPYVIEPHEIDLLVDVAGNALQRAVA